MLVVEDGRIGAALRALRRRLGLRQLDVALAAGVSESTVSDVERGHIDTLSLRQARAIFAAVDARLLADIVWRGGALDRLLDERHALLTGRVAELLCEWGWQVATEVTFSRYGERGPIDLLARTRVDADSPRTRSGRSGRRRALDGVWTAPATAAASIRAAPRYGCGMSTPAALGSLPLGQ